MHAQSPNSVQYASFRPLYQVGMLAIAKLAFLGVSVILYKSLPIADVGTFSVIFAIAIILATVSECGLRGLLVREMARHREAPEDSRRLLAGALKARLLTLFPCIALGVISAWLVTPGSSLSVIMLLLIAAWCDSNSMVFRGALRAYDYIILDAAIAGFFRLILLSLTALLYWQGQLTLQLFAIVFATVAAADSLLSLLLVATKTKVPLTLQSNLTQTLLMIRRGLPFIIVTIIGIIYLRVAVLMLGLFPDETALDKVAAFNLSGRIPEGVAFLPIALMNAAIPYFARNSGNINALLPIFRKLELVLGIAGIMISIGIVAFAEQLILLLATRDYLQFSLVFRLYGLTVFFSFIQYLFSNLLISIDQEKRVAVRHGAVLLLNIALNSVLIWQFGLLGAVLALLISEMVAVFVDFRFLAALGININRRTLLSWSAALLSFLLLAWISLQLPAFYGLITYVSISSLVGAIILAQAQLSHVGAPSA